MKRLGTTVLVLVGLILIAAVLLSVFISPIALRIINSQMSRWLAVPATLEGIQISLPEGRVQLQQLMLGRAVQEEDGDALALGTADVAVNIRSLFGDVIEIDHIRLADITLSLVRSKTGEFHFEQLIKTDTNTPAETPPAASTNASASRLPRFFIREVRIEKVRIHYRDYSLGDEPLDLLITNLMVQADKLSLFGPLGKPEMNGHVAMGCYVYQQHTDPAQLGLLASLDTITTHIPAVNALMDIVYLRLSTLKPLVPRGTERTIGGESLDMQVKASLSPDFLRVDGLLSTESMNIPMRISGTPDRPDISQAGIFLGVLSRGFGGALNTVDHVAGAGLDAAGTVADTGWSVAKGAGRTAEHVGRGLFELIRGIVTLNPHAVAQGAKQATVDAGEQVVDTVVSAGTNLADGVESTADQISGAAAAKEWEAMSHGRWEEAREKAERELDAMPYPGLDGAGH